MGNATTGKSRMKIGLYSPFMSEYLGGGERYFLSVAECLLAGGHQVDLIFKDNFLKNPRQKEKLKRKYARVFSLDVDKLNLINGPFGKIKSTIKRLKFTQKYSAFYYMTDGSFFISGAKRNAVHFMFPFKKPHGGFLNKLKLRFWQIKTSNSFFTKKQIEKNWQLKIDYVHGGIVDQRYFKPLRKKNIILNVGRFFTASANKHCKRQDILVEVFKKMHDQGLRNWELVLIGSIAQGKDNINYAKKIKKQTRSYPIKVIHDASFKELRGYYGKARIYWHATGFGLDENENPKSMEHLGISTIEAMAAGCVPIVIKKGGQKEIVSEGKNGLLWETKEELIKKTLKVMSDKKLWQKLSTKAQKRAQEFSKERFCRITREIFGF